MFGYVEAPSSYRRAQGMARAAGVDLAAAVVDGWLRRDELAGLLRRCEACRLTPLCSGRRRGAAAPLPGYCCLKRDLEALAAG